MFPLSKRNMNSNIDLTMICNKNHHIKMYDQKVKIVLFTVKIVKNFCTRLAWAFPAKKIRLSARTLIVELSKVAIPTGYPSVNGSGNTIVALGERTKVIISTQNGWSQKKFLAIHRLPDLHDSTALTLFLFGPRLRARRVFIQSSGRLGLVVWYLRQVFISYLHLQIIINFAKF